MSAHSPYGEKEMLLRIADGDEEAFSMLYRLYARKIFPYLFKLIGSEEAVEDVIQNTFLALWLYRLQLPEVDNLSGYIYRTAANQGFNWMSRNKRYREIEKKVASESDTPVDFTFQQVLFKETERLVNLVVSELPEKRREIFRLHRDKGLSYNEIAEQLGIAPSTVRNTISAALDNIRKRLIESGILVFIIFFYRQ